MRKLFALCTLFFVVVAVGVLFAQTKPVPAKPIVYQAKNGNVAFDHTSHVKAVKGDCKACHDKLFPQDAKAPLNFKAGAHQPAIKAKTSCAACHVAGGTAFAVTGNCAKCHKKAAA